LIIINKTNILVSPGQELGFGFTPPYLAPTTIGPVILKGVNYASGGGGILNSTGQVFVSFCFILSCFKLEVGVKIFTKNLYPDVVSKLNSLFLGWST
jgi:hypothetical protein